MTETFAETFRALRRARGLTQNTAAQRCGVTPVTVWLWENGRCRPWDDGVAALACMQVVQPGRVQPDRVPARPRLIDQLGEHGE
jgi:transcriptional regulator with XRE-family HTH domain